VTKKSVFLFVLALAIIIFFAVINLRQQERLFPIKKDGKWGLIDKRGKIIIQPQFKNITYWSEGLTGVEIGKIWGFIDNSGKLVIPAKFDSAGIFSEGMATVRINGKHGFINKKGKIVITPSYFVALDFHEGLAAVRINEEDNDWVYVDRQGRIMKPEIPQTVYYPHKLSSMPTNQFSDGLAPIYVENERKYSFIDKKGKLKKWRFDYVLDFSEGLAPVARDINGDFKMTYIDTSGNPAFDYKFDAVMPFTEGLAGVMIDKKFCYIDKKGRIVIKLDPDYTGYHFSEGLAQVCKGDNKCGFIDRKGKMVVEPKFSSSFGDPYGDFRGGLADVSQIEGDIWIHGYIDKTGKYFYKYSEEKKK
jgi:hypothetical protein